ncbi:MAG: ABC transporter ATP-binding protein [Candidatus Odinarchaeota archaeon]
MLEIWNLHVKIGNKEILKGINLNIPNGEVHTLFGPNGSGKSTLMMTIMGYPEYEITEGQILFDGKDIQEMNITERAKLGIAISQQRPPSIKGIKLKDIFNFYIQSHQNKEETVNELIKKFNIEGFVERDINSGFSGGEIKRLELFQVLVANPKFILLDEPDSGVDPVQLSILSNMINDCLKFNSEKHSIKRKTGLIITHSGNILEYVHVDKAHLLIDGIIHCTGNPGIMLDQIKAEDYSYCIKCQTITRNSFEVKK